MKAGNFSMSFRVFEELDGKQMILEFPSALDFFKNEVQKCKEVQSLPLSMNNSNEIKMHKNKEAQAQEIINAIEKIKQIQETQNKVISYFLNILKNINITDTETKFFFNAQYNSLIKQAEKGNFLNSFIFSYTIDNEWIEKNSLSIFDFLQNVIKKYKEMQEASLLKANSADAEKYGTKATQAQEIINVIKKINATI